MAQTDLTLPGVLPLVLRRVHLSSYRWGTLFGRTWASTLDQRVEIGPDGSTCFVAEDGVVLYYPGAETALVGDAVLPIEGLQRWPLRSLPDGTRTVEDPDNGVIRSFGRPDCDGRCLIQEISDRFGNTISFDYDVRQIICGVRHSGGYRVDIDVVAGRVAGISVHDQSKMVSVSSFAYDATGDLLRVNNSADEALRFQCDDAGRIVQWTDRNGIWYRYEYDADGRCARTSGRGRVLSYGFCYLPGRTLVTDSLGSISAYEYNESGQVNREIDPLGNITSSVWDRYDRLLLRTDPMGRSTQLHYDDAGRLIKVTLPDGRSETLQRNGLGVPVVTTDAGGAQWRAGFDESGGLVCLDDPMGQSTRYGRAPSGAVASVTDPLGAVTTVTTNAAGFPTLVLDAVGGETAFCYDGFGRLARTVDPLGGVTTFQWTVEGKLASRTGPDGACEVWIWDGEGNLTSYTDAAGGRTELTNGVFDLPVSRTAPDGGRTLFAYDTELRLTSVQNPAGLRWEYAYDAAGRLVGETDFNGRVQRYGYDAVGRLSAMVNGLAQVTTFTYDVSGDLVERRSVDGVTRLEYDAVGRLTGAAGVDAVVHLDRDGLGRVTRETVNGRSVSSVFDAAGRRVSRLTPAGVGSAWTYDDAGQPKALMTAGETVDFTFDAAGREVGRVFASGGRMDQTFDSTHRLITQVMGAGGPPTLGSVAAPHMATARTFFYRGDGTMVGLSDPLTGRARRFDLDSSARVTGVRADCWSEGYAYDSSGNLARAVSSGIDGPPAGENRPSYSGTLVTRAGNVTYGYDGQGRVVTRSRRRPSRKSDTWRYFYDAADRMALARSADASWSYTYDPFGRRISKQRLDGDGRIVEQTIFSWDGDRLIEQTYLGPAATRPIISTWEYLPGTWRPITQAVGETADELEFFAIVSDLVGTPTELVTPDGRRVAWSNADRNLWGAPAGRSAHGKNLSGAAKYWPDCPLRFPGQYADDETGLHYNRHRYYDPASARYTTADPLGLSPAADPHRYVRNPTRWADPLGLAPCKGDGSDPSGLVGHEANGGHTIARHVGKSDSYLDSRKVRHASTFPDLETASHSTAMNVADNARAVELWLQHSPYAGLTIDSLLAPGSGVTWVRASGQRVVATGIRTSLRRDALSPNGYLILTSYPII